MKKDIEFKIINNEKKVFCTECGEELDDFDFNPQVNDMDAIYERFHGCKEKGKFKGDICSRIFIASQNEDEFQDEELD